jgi:hypothetical protein
VREAIELGINKKEIIDKLLFGFAPRWDAKLP